MPLICLQAEVGSLMTPSMYEQPGLRAQLDCPATCWSESFILHPASFLATSRHYCRSRRSCLASQQNTARQLQLPYWPLLLQCHANCAVTWWSATTLPVHKHPVIPSTPSVQVIKPVHLCRACRAPTATVQEQLAESTFLSSAFALASVSKCFRTGSRIWLSARASASFRSLGCSEPAS